MKNGDIIACLELGSDKSFFQIVHGRKRKLIAFHVSHKDLAKGCNAPRPGFYGFYGLQNRKKPMSHNSYGKIDCLRGRTMGRLTKRNVHRFRCFSGGI